jgi:hypothetical protein
MITSPRKAGESGLKFLETLVSELDEAWALALAEAEQQARLSGRAELAEYLALRNSNDLLRRTGIDWLLLTFTDLAAKANRHGSSIQTSNIDGHRFRRGQATMVGRLLTLKSGVRTVFVEAGWPRTPRDGFVRGGGLACANIRHLGLSSLSDELLLIKSNTGSPSWVVVGKHGSRHQINEASIAHHLEVLVDKK